MDTLTLIVVLVVAAAVGLRSDCGAMCLLIVVAALILWVVAGGAFGQV